MTAPGYVAHILELLEPLGPVRARAMMGGHTIHCGALPIALIADERLYLKVDAQTKDAFARAGGEPFTYSARGKSVEMSYWSPPDAALDDPDEMLPWARLALAAAGRARSRSRSGSRSRSRSGSRSGSRSRSRSGSALRSPSRSR